MKRSHGVRVGTIALLAAAGVTIPANSAHAEDPILCGLLTCDNTAGTTPVDVDIDLDGDIDVMTDVDTDTNPDLDVVVDLSGTGIDDGNLVANADLGTSVLAQSDDLVAGTAGDLGVDARAGEDGVVVTAGGVNATGANVPTPIGNVMVDALTGPAASRSRSSAAPAPSAGTRRVPPARPAAPSPKPAASPTCAACTSSSAAPPTRRAVRSRAQDPPLAATLAAARSVADVCGIQITALGSSSTQCGGDAGASAGSGALVDATGLVEACGVSVAVAGSNETTCRALSPTAPGTDTATGTEPGTAPAAGAGTDQGSAPALRPAREQARRRRPPVAPAPRATPQRATAPADPAVHCP